MCGRCAPVGKPLRDAVRALGQHRQDGFVGDERAAGSAFRVVLAQERRDDLVVVDLGACVRKGRRFHDAPRAHVNHRQLDEIALPVETEHVLITVAHGHHALRLPHRVDRADLIAIRRGELVLEIRRRVGHAPLELPRQLVVAAVEEQADRAHLLAVKGRIDGEDARRGAALDLNLETRPLPAHELPIGARAKLKMLLDEVQRAPRRGRGMVRSEVSRAVVVRASNGLEPRPLVRGGEPERQVLFVVPELDVVFWFLLLDETVLENHRFLLGNRDDRLEIANRAKQNRNERASVARAFLEVAPHPRAEALGFSDVKDVRLCDL